VPQVRVDDYVEVHWEERGEGPLAVLVPYCTMHPSAYDPLAAKLAADHRALRYDARGSGRSTRSGPHDMETGASDLAAVIEAAGEPAVTVCMGDAANCAVRVGSRHPELVEAIVAPGGLPAGRSALEGTEAMASSDTVVEALLSMVETDYRGALRSLVTAGNPQMSEEEIRERVRLQAEYQDRDVTLERLRVWSADDPSGYARACEERLWLLFAEGMTGGWFPAGREAAAMSRKLFPEANVRMIDDGIVSRPDLTAAVVRQVSAGARAAS
jgi:pimeloyl-ACP methyl ester carboxylesterase